MEILSTQLETGENSFIGALVFSQGSTANKWISREEKVTFKMVGNFVAFLFVIFLPSIHGSVCFGKSSSLIPVLFCEPAGAEQI